VFKEKKYINFRKELVIGLKKAGHDIFFLIVANGNKGINNI